MQVTTKYLPPTNTKPSRISVSGPYGRRVYSYDYASHDPHLYSFIRYLKSEYDKLDFYQNPNIFRDHIRSFHCADTPRGYIYTNISIPRYALDETFDQLAQGEQA